MQAARTERRQRSAIRSLSPRGPRPAGRPVLSALLEAPTRDELRNIDRDEAARLLDEVLRRVGSREAALRLRLGRLAASLQRTRAYHRLGFSRIGDYAVERLGISGRRLQLSATVRRKLDSFPLLESAYLGGFLNWTKLVLVLRAATPESSARWLDLATRLTARELRSTVDKWVRAAESKNDPAGLGIETAGVCARAECPSSRGERLEDPDDDDDEIDGEPRANLRVRCPARVRALWRDAAEFAARSTGGPLSTWQVLELVVAEAASIVDFEPESAASHSTGRRRTMKQVSTRCERCGDRIRQCGTARSSPRCLGARTLAPRSIPTGRPVGRRNGRLAPVVSNVELPWRVGATERRRDRWHGDVDRRLHRKRRGLRSPSP